MSIASSLALPFSLNHEKKQRLFRVQLGNDYIYTPTYTTGKRKDLMSTSVSFCHQILLYFLFFIVHAITVLYLRCRLKMSLVQASRTLVCACSSCGQNVITRCLSISWPVAKQKKLTNVQDGFEGDLLEFILQGV